MRKLLLSSVLALGLVACTTATTGTGTTVTVNLTTAQNTVKIIKTDIDAAAAVMLADPNLAATAKTSLQSGLSLFDQAASDFTNLTATSVPTNVHDVATKVVSTLGTVAQSLPILTPDQKMMATLAQALVQALLANIPTVTVPPSPAAATLHLG